jgi:hypothetical protein
MQSTSSDFVRGLFVQAIGLGRWDREREKEREMEEWEDRSERRRVAEGIVAGAR